MCRCRSSPGRRATFSSRPTTTRFSNTTARTRTRLRSPCSATRLHPRRTSRRRRRRKRNRTRARRHGGDMAATVELGARGIVGACGSCGQKNRLMYDRLGDEVRCGQCKATIALPGSPIEIRSSADFDRLVARSAVPVVVDYWAPWCGPCRMVAPELQKVAARQAGRVLVVKVNTDVLSDLGQRYAIRSIPTMAVCAGGKEVARTPGARPAEEIETFVHQSVPPLVTKSN